MQSFVLTDVLRPIERQPPQRLNRTLYLLVLASFFLPFATVRSCAGEEGVSHTGIGLLQEDAGALLVGVLLLTVLLFVGEIQLMAVIVVLLILMVFLILRLFHLFIVQRMHIWPY